MSRLLATAALACLLPAAAAAQPHTVVALSHTDHTAYEIDPATGAVLRQFTAAEQPHAAARPAVIDRVAAAPPQPVERQQQPEVEQQEDVAERRPRREENDPDRFPKRPRHRASAAPASRDPARAHERASGAPNRRSS